MIPHRFFRLMLLFVLAWATVWTIHLPAQAGEAATPEEPSDEAEASPPIELETVVTVATRTERPEEEIPESVSVVTDEELETGQASNLGEALQHEHSVDLSGGPRGNAQSLVIRGIGGKRILLNVDGARQNFDGGHRSRLMIDPELLKSVEVLRGPASSQYGSGAIGGVVALTTKDAADLLEPGDKLGGRIKLGYEDANDERLNAASVFGRFGALDLLADFSDRDSGNLRQGGGEELPHSALDTGSELFKLGWLPSGAHHWGLSLQRFDQSGRSPSNPSQESGDSNPLLDRDNAEDYLTAGYTYQPAAGRIANASITAYRNTLDIVEDQVDEPRHDELDFDTTGASALMSLNFAPAAQTLTFGIDGYRDRGKATRDGEPRPQFPDAEQTVWGAFLQNEFTPISGLRLIPGIRYDSYESEANTGEQGRVESSESSLRLGSVYSVNEWLALHANYAEAFRAPNLVENYAAGTHFLGNEFRPNPDLRPEKAANTEFGFRLNFGGLFGLDNTLQLRANWYDNDVEDFIETVVIVETEGPVPPPTQCLPLSPAPGCINENNPLAPPVYIGGHTTSENLPEAQIKGRELLASFSAGDWLMELSHDKVRGTNLENGDPLVNIPADTLRGHLAYSFSSMKLGLRVTHTSDQERVPPEDPRVAGVFRPTKGYSVTDLYYRWTPHNGRFDGLSLTVGLDNLTDRRYRRHLSLFNEAGRSARAVVSYRF